MRITIDPGHTKNVNKGVISGYYEGNAMYKLAGFLADELMKYKNMDVLVTRKEDENPTLDERGKLAVNSKSRMFISLHSNSVSNAESASYVCGFYSVKRGVTKALCEKLVSAVCEAMKSTSAKNKGALTRKTTTGEDYYGVIRSSVSGKSEVEYSFIIEHGFHSNKKQCEFLMQDENLKKIALAEAEAIAEYFKLEKKNNFAVLRTQVPPLGDLNDYVTAGEFYYGGYAGWIKNGPPTEGDEDPFILDVETSFYQDVPYVIQRIYYVNSGKEYVRGIYVRDGKFDEVHKEWFKK